MKRAVRLFAAFLACAWILGTGVSPAVAAGGMCPMGGAMIMAETDHDKALAWAKSLKRVAIDDAGPADWSVITFSAADEGIGVLIGPGQVFFGVAGRGGETYPRYIEKTFGADLAKLRDAVSKTLPDLAAAGAVKLQSVDIQAITVAAGLGTLQKGADGWKLTKQECQAVDLPTSGL